MKIMIISDTHDNLEKIRNIIKLANQKFDLLIHCGDLCSPFTAKEFLKLKIPFIYVFGNNDAEKRLIEDILIKKGKVYDVFVDKIERYHFFVYHGTYYETIEKAINSQLFDFVIYGHTHKFEIKKLGKSLLINPGELCAYLSGKSSFCALDLDAKLAQVISEGEVIKEVHF